MVGIIYNGNEGEDLIIRGYFDSNWTRDNTIRKLTSGFIFILNKGLVSQCLKWQIIMALSSIKTKYMVQILATKVTTQIRLLLTKIELLDENSQYVMIKLVRSMRIKQIKADVKGQKREIVNI